MKTRYLLPLISGLFIWSCNDRTDLGADILEANNPDFVNPSETITSLNALASVVSATSDTVSVVSLARDTLLAGRWRGGNGVVTLWFDAYRLLDAVSIRSTTDTLDRLEIRLGIDSTKQISPCTDGTEINLISSKVDSVVSDTILYTETLSTNNCRNRGEIRVSIPNTAVEQLKEHLCMVKNALTTPHTVVVENYTVNRVPDADSITIAPIDTQYIGGPDSGICLENKIVYRDSVTLWKNTTDTSQWYSYSYSETDLSELSRVGIRVHSGSALPILSHINRISEGAPILIPWVSLKSGAQLAVASDTLQAKASSMSFTEDDPTLRAKSPITFAAARRAATLAIDARPYWNALIDSTGATENRSIHTMKVRVPLRIAALVDTGRILYRYTLSSNDSLADSLDKRWNPMEFTLNEATDLPDTIELEITDPNRFVVNTPDTLYLHLSPQLRTGRMSGFLEWGAEGSPVEFTSTVSVLRKE